MRKIFAQILRKLSYFTGVFSQGAYRAGHYYSPIPSRVDIKRSLQGKNKQVPLHDIDLRPQHHRELLQELSRFYRDIPFPEEKGEQSRYYFNQGWFCYSDAIILYSLIRHFNIRRIVEIGSGYSSAVMLDTMEKFIPGDFDLTFIEPFPDRLHSIVELNTNPRVNLIEQRVQDVDFKTFETLEAGDLLFIDSSHVLKYNSDLHYLIFDVLSKLPVGVFVHFHDIFYPFEYPDKFLKMGKYWNECYVLRAFLSGNKDWEIVFFNHYANLMFTGLIEQKMPLCLKNHGGSFYMKKIGCPLIENNLS